MTSSKTLLGSVLLAIFSLSVIAHGSAKFKAAVSYTVGTKPSAAAVGDFNGDGKLDVAVVNSGDASVGDNGGLSILIGNGDGTLKSAANVSAGTNPLAVAVADPNGDGRADLVLADSSGIGILLGNGDGTFDTLTHIASTGFSSFVTGDFNRDGRLDLAIVDASGSLAVLLGNGDGTFQGPTNVVTSNRVFFIAVADFNNDGKLDVVASSSVYPASLNIFLGNGDGTFQLPTTIVKCGVICTATWVLAGVADLNQDGNMDQVIVQNANCGPFGHLTPCGEIFTFLGNGDASFGPPPGGWEVPGGSPVAIADFNGDGKLDIAVSRSTSSQCINARGCVFVLAGNGDGTFQNATSLPVGPTPDWVISADLNNDKAPDLVAVNTDNTISVLINSGTDFSIKASTFSPTPVGPGQSATSTLSLSLLNTFNNPVALSCNVQPSQAGAPGCSITPSSVTFDSAGHASAQLTVTAGSSTASTDGPSRLWALKSLVLGVFPIAGLALMGVRKDKKRIRRNAFTMIFGAVLCIALVLGAGCGGAAGGVTQPKSYAITVTGDSGSAQHSTTTTLTIQ